MGRHVNNKSHHMQEKHLYLLAAVMKKTGNGSRARIAEFARTTDSVTEGVNEVAAYEKRMT
jgi:hypothetical protein